MLSKRYKSTEVDRRTWLHVPSESTCSQVPRRKEKKSDSVKWQKPQYLQKIRKQKQTDNTKAILCNPVSSFSCRFLEWKTNSLVQHLAHRKRWEM